MRVSNAFVNFIVIIKCSVLKFWISLRLGIKITGVVHSEKCNKKILSENTNLLNRLSHSLPAFFEVMFLLLASVYF